MRLSIAILAAFISTSLSQTTPAQPPITLPYQLGPYPVSSVDYELLTNRSDPLAPDSENRRLMLSIYQPLTDLTTCPDPVTIPYMPPRSAQAFEDFINSLTSFGNNTITRLSATYCQPGSSSTFGTQDLPIVLISHGLGGTRLLHQTIGPALASTGNYVVITVDHTYDSAVVEFPNGDLVLSNVAPRAFTMTLEEQQAFLGPVVGVRAADLVSVLDAVESGQIPGLEGCGAHRPGGLRAGVLGHSLGGATAALAMLDDSRIAGGINMDGGVYDRALNTSTAKPFVMVGGEHGALEEEIINSTWNPHYESLQGFRRRLRVEGARHLSFWDLMYAADVLGIRNSTVPEQLGTITGERLLRIQYSYFADFFNMLLKGEENAGLMEGPSPEFEEVGFVRADHLVGK